MRLIVLLRPGPCSCRCCSFSSSRGAGGRSTCCRYTVLGSAPGSAALPGLCAISWAFSSARWWAPRLMGLGGPFRNGAFAGFNRRQERIGLWRRNMLVVGPYRLCLCALMERVATGSVHRVLHNRDRGLACRRKVEPGNAHRGPDDGPPTGWSTPGGVQALRRMLHDRVLAPASPYGRST